MSHTVAELYAETIVEPSPAQLKGHCYYVDPKDEAAILFLEQQAIHEKWMGRLDDLKAGGFRKYRRLFQDKEYRNRPTIITVPVWVAVVLTTFSFIWRR